MTIVVKSHVHRQVSFIEVIIFDYAIATKNSHCKKASFSTLLYHFIEFFVMSFLLNSIISFSGIADLGSEIGFNSHRDKVRNIKNRALLLLLLHGPIQ